VIINNQRQLLEAFTTIYDGRTAEPILEHPLVYKKVVVALNKLVMIIVPIDLITSECLVEFKKHGTPKLSIDKVNRLSNIDGFKTNLLNLKRLELENNNRLVIYETVFPTKNCSDCEGEGCITCSECGNDTPCFICGGTGKINIAGAAPYKRACITRIKINVNGIEVFVDKRLLDIVITTLKYFAGTWNISIKHKLEKIVFVNSIGVKLIMMPCKER
jgi:hypothetical protein